MSQKFSNNDNIIKEDFCAACLSIPVAMASSMYSGKGNKPGSYRKTKNITLMINIMITLVALGIGIYMFFIKKCSSCVGPPT